MDLTITNRELLRNYKQLKERLIRGEIKTLNIEQKDGTYLEVNVRKQRTPFEQMTDLVRKHPFKTLKRPEGDIFDVM